MTSIEVAPYLRRGSGGSSVTIPDDRFEGLRRIALESPDRRFRLGACLSHSLVASYGSGEQRVRASRTLAALAVASDALVARNARWHLANPVDERRLGRLLAQKE